MSKSDHGDPTNSETAAAPIIVRPSDLIELAMLEMDKAGIDRGPTDRPHSFYRRLRLALGLGDE